MSKYFKKGSLKCGVCVCERERETMENCAPGLTSWIFSLIEKTFLLREREREHLIPHPVCKGIHGLQCLSLSISLPLSLSRKSFNFVDVDGVVSNDVLQG